jgi:hypothetical protein
LQKVQTNNNEDKNQSEEKTKQAKAPNKKAGFLLELF